MLLVSGSSIEKATKITDIMHLYNIRLIIQYYVLRGLLEYKINKRNANKELRQDVLTTMTLDITVFWNMIP
jgi:hypothetical protein